MLPLRLELAHALWRGPAAIVRLRARGWAWLALYLALCAGLLAACGFALVRARPALEDAVLGYLFPGSWQRAVRVLAERFAQPELKALLVNATIGASLLLTQLFLFPLKDKLSAVVEDELAVTGEPPSELPLWLQAWEEVKLFLGFAAAQGTIFWIGYAPEPWRRELAVVLSYLALFVSFAIDFLSPVLQRHRLRYSTMLKAFARHPLLLLAFGTLFTLPAVVAGKLVAAHPGWSFATSVVVVFAANVVCVAWAAVAGTWAGGQLLGEARATRPPGGATRAAAWMLLAGLLAWNGYRFGAVAVALHGKSQILKCDYRVDPGSFGFDRPQLADLFALAHKRVRVRMHIDLEISNPTRHRVTLERSRLELRHDGARVAMVRLSPLAVEPGQTARQTLSFPVEVSPSVVNKGRELLSGKRWDLTLYLEVAPGFEFPIYLVTR